MLYLSLFASAFIAATLLPAFSEVHLGILVDKGLNPFLLWLAATSGNSLGAFVNYWLGTQVLRFQHKAWFPVKPKQLEKAHQQFERYGIWSLLFAWLPIVGDPLTFIAGILRCNFWLFALLVTIGKGLRYAIVLLVVL
ncbi:DedA family protein [Catenovulum sp. SM1970]|uniref:YqaA family protein n=1 Tax=Marinifaba aquimaris TaxID=2741323 RepID=UPI00157218C9|nr:YqaA family protein [Marinifaba aquimaris]NTS78636.1 DedA family protein [Marinifaba aquimaris]